MNTEEGGISSNVALSRIFEAWHRGLLMIDNNPHGITGIPIIDNSNRNVAHWWNNIDLYGFDPYAIQSARNIIRDNLNSLIVALDGRLN